MPLSPLCPYCEIEDKSVGHALFCCPRVVRIWRLANLLHGIFSIPNLRVLGQFEALDSEIAKVPKIHIIYITYHICLSRNSWVFDVRRLSMWFCGGACSDVGG